MSDILIGQSYYLRFDPKSWAAMQPYPPLGSLYSASYLRDRGHHIDFFDAMLASSEEDWRTKIRETKPDIAIIYEDNFNYLSKMCLLRMREASFRMISIATDQGCRVIVAGSDPTDQAAQYIHKGADYVLLGEGEETLAELLQVFGGDSGFDLDAILGLAYREHGKIRINPRRPELRDLDDLPFPAWDLVDVDRYRDIWVNRHGYFSMNMATTRGCPFHCNWCAKPIWGQRYNVRSPENVLDEMKWLKDSYQPDHIWFADDILGLKPGWLPRFAELIRAEGFSIPFKCLNRADLLLRPGEIEALKTAGCTIVWIGAESGSQKILDAMEKGTRVEQIYESARRLHAAGIQAGFFIQFGYPGELRSDIEKTIEMIKECRPDDIGISVSYPLPGTPFHARVKADLGGKKNWMDSNDLAMLYRGPYTTRFYRQLHRVVHKEFRLSKSLRQNIKNVVQFSQNTRGTIPGTYSKDEKLVDFQKPDNHSNSLKLLFRRIRPLLDRTTLPIDRFILAILEHLPHHGSRVSTRRLSLEEAARPTPQDGQGKAS